MFDEFDPASPRIRGPKDVEYAKSKWRFTKDIFMNEFLVFSDDDQTDNSVQARTVKEVERVKL